MDQSSGKQSATKALLTLAILFVVFVFALFKFGSNKQAVYNPEISGQDKITREEVLESLKREQESELWSNYLDKIFTESGSSPEELSQQYKVELESKTSLPEEIVFISGKVVGNSFDERSRYLNAYEALFASARDKGVFSESKLFFSQIEDGSKLLKLSDYDKGTLLRVATEYELWSKEVLNLDTPTQYEKRSLNAASDMLQIAYILRKVVEENDDQVYVLWIGQYIQKVFDILASRYVK